MADRRKQSAEKYTSTRIVLVQDVTLSVLASLLSVLLVRWISEPIPGFTTVVVHSLLFAAAGSLIGMLVSGLHRIVRRYLSYSVVSRILATLLLKETVMILAVLLGWILLPTRTLTVCALAVDTLLTAIAMIYPRFASAVLYREEASLANLSYRRNALIMGTGPDAVQLADQAERIGRYVVLGFLSSDPAMAGRVLRDKMVYTYTSTADIEALHWRLGGIDCILFPKDAGRKNPEINLPESVKQTDGMSGVEHFIKRSFDIVLSAILLIIFSPALLVCAIAIRLEDGDPVIYSQERIGRGGKPFNILKFRSMRKDAEAGGPELYAGEEDPRLTRVGKFLRQHHLDELPQLWNVFRGDMSFIGYRPERQYYIDQIMERNPRYQYLYQIRPGVTSYATLYNGYTDTLEKMLTRLDLDLYYLRNHSLRFDMMVLAKTFFSIIGGKKF